MLASFNQVRLHYLVEGPSGGLPLVFVNSLGTDLHAWDAVAPHFADRLRVIRYDKRGQGFSDTPPGPYTLRTHSDDLAALLDGLEVVQAILVGMSVGGMVAMDFALHAPERVGALVLSDTGPTIGTPAGWQERIRAVQEQGLAGMAETILRRWFMPSFPQTHAATYQVYRDLLAHSSAEGYVATCAALRDADLREQIAAIAAPTLVLCGAGDPVVTPEQTREWAACLPNARVAVIDDAAHLPCIEQPEAFTAALAAFLKEECHV